MNNEEGGGSSSGPPLPTAPLHDALGADFAAQDFDPVRDLARHPKHDYVLATLNNTLTVLTRHPEWREVIAYDEFSGRIMKRKPPPFAVSETGEWTDFDDVRTQSWISKNLGFEPKKQTLLDAVLLAADHGRYHEVRQYLHGLTWDRTERVNTWLVEYLGAGAFFEKSDSEAQKHRKELTNQYLMEAGRMWLLAAVARVFRPGCKMDYVLILEGEQQIGKSTALSILGGDWFTDASFKIGDKDALQLIRGKWIVELQELDSFNRAESSAAKAFFSQYIDRYRASYGHRPTDVPRQCVFAGTVNHETYFKDDTGNRRYWPVRCSAINLDRLRKDRDQLWAEATARFLKGERWEPGSAQRELFEQEQEARYVGDAWEPVIRKWIRENSYRRVTTSEGLQSALHLDKSKWTRQEEQRVGSILRRMGWKRKRETDGDRQWYFEAPSDAVEIGPTVPPRPTAGGTEKAA
jgi:putative DNA primase/helicase